MNRIKVNEKQLGVGLVIIGLVGLLAGFRFSSGQAGSSLSAETRRISNATNHHRQTERFETAASASPQEQGRQPCKVLSVYDGDTIGCDLDGDGRIEKPVEEIRLLGIDTPERSYSRKNRTYDTDHPTDEPYSKESSEWMEHLTNHKIVYLAYDLRHHDRYGRTLAFVYASPASQPSLNLQAVQQGYARMLFIGKNRLYEDQFIQAEDQAREAKRGLWGLPAN